jgi:AraC family transcriptional activator of mar-sox-rob regulon
MIEPQLNAILKPAANLARSTILCVRLGITTRGANMLWSLSTDITESSPRHQHALFEFALCRDRGGRLLTDDEEIEFQPTRTILIPPNTPHSFAFKPGEVGHLKIVCVPPNDLSRFLSPMQVAMIDGLCHAGVTVADYAGQEQWFSQLTDLILDGFGNDDMRTEQLSWSAVTLLLALHAKAQHAAADHSARYSAKLRDIVAWIENNLQEDLTIEQAASQFGLSRSLLTKEFRIYTGKSFVDYRNTRRVQKAAMALVSQSDSVTQAALESGFSNLSHFHRQFKAYFGLTPAAFRRKLIEEGSA